MRHHMNSQSIIQFWFNEIDKSLWFKKDANFDQLIRSRFIEVYHSATQSELFHWRKSAEGCLAEIILLDQFSRNLFRESAAAFSQDSLALCLAQSAIEKEFDQQLSVTQRSFMYMPFMHSESLIIHDEAMKLFSQEGLDNNLDFEIRHRDIILEFGRYPHRNELLGRKSSDAELTFLAEPGSSF